MARIVVTGASGYIGSHTMIDLLNNGFEVVGIDNQSNSSAKSYQRIEQITGKKIDTHVADIIDKTSIRSILSSYPDINGVIHFAALKSVEESVVKPFSYFENNITGMNHLLEVLQEFKIQNFIFSSSCTVYGNTTDLPVTESSPWHAAESPYGLSKQIGEMILENLCKLNKNFKAISLRYFNPAGAHPSALLGEAAIVEVRNLIPLIMEVGAGKRAQLNVFGNDYPTRDGTNIRDYIHILDLAHAHTLALNHLLENKANTNYTIYNIGSGNGVSILEAIHAFEKVTNQKLNYKIVDRRPGDVVAIYADYSKAKSELGWSPQHDIDDIIRDAWAWEQNKSQFLEQ